MPKPAKKPAKAAKPKAKAKPKASKPADSTAKNQRGRPFQPGQSGNPKGRPPGSRNALCRAYIEDLKAVWDEKGKAAIRELAKDNPAAFARLVGALVPQEFDLGDKTAATFGSFLKAMQAGAFKPRAFDPHEDDDA